MKPHLKYGIHLAIAFLLLQIITDLLSLPPSFMITLVTFIIIGAASYLAMRERRMQNGGFLSYGKAYGTGALTVLIGGLIAGIGYYLFLKVFYHQMVTEVIIPRNEEAFAKAYDEGGISKEMYDMFMSNIGLYSGPGLMSLAVFFSIEFYGLLMNLIIALFGRKEDPNPPMPYN